MRKLVLIAALAGYSVFANALEGNFGSNVYSRINSSASSSQISSKSVYGSHASTVSQGNNRYLQHPYYRGLVQGKRIHLVSNEHGPANPTGKFAPVELQENIFPLYDNSFNGLKNMEYQVIRAITTPTQTSAKVVYGYAMHQLAPKVKSFLLEQGLDSRNIQMIEQAHPLYPLYVGLGTFGKNRPTCTYSMGDSSFVENIGAVDDVAPCFIENNMIIQSVY